MRRIVIALASVTAVLALAEPASAQSLDWPDYPAQYFQRGPGLYLSWIKLAVFWVFFLVWVATSDWVNQDAQRCRLKYAHWNALVFFTFMTFLISTWVIPIYWVSLPLMVLAYVVPLGLYVRQRNKVVAPHETVMNSEHLRFVIAVRLNRLGFEISTERKTMDESGAPVTLNAQGAETDRDNSANLIKARQSPGFVAARDLMGDALDRGADSVLLDFTAEAVGTRYEIDGVWHTGESQDRESGDIVLNVVKTLSALDPDQRRARQQGTFGAEYNGAKLTCKLVTQGTQTGERAIIQLIDNRVRFEKLPDVGMREKMLEQFKQILAEPEGIVLLSAPPRQGLTTTADATLNTMDRFLRSFVAIEDARHPERAIENVPVTTYDGATATPMSVLPGLLRLYPDVLVVRDMVDTETVELLCQQATQKRFVLSSVRAKDTAEALLRVLALKVSPSTFAPTALAALNQRLVRKLCQTCKEAYAPPEQLLRQLRIPAGKIEALYRPPTEPERVCPDCSGIGYKGRTAVFELLVMNDDLRKLLATTPKLDVLRAAARKAGMRPLQEEGILLVLKGVTSLAELTRVLKQ